MADAKVSALTALTGANVAGDDVYPIVDTSVTTTKKITHAEHILAHTKPKLGSFTRDVSTASGDQAVTGVGFAPRCLTFFAELGAAVSVQASWGFDDGTLHFCTAQTGGPVMTASASASIYLSDGTNSYLGAISALGADGFTITWTKGNAPTGTATIYYKAER